MSSFMRGAVVSAALIMTLALAAYGNGDLTRSGAEQILNGAAFSSVCVAQPQFIDGAFPKAQAAGVVPARPSTVGWFGMMNVYKIADLPNGDAWQATTVMGGVVVVRKSQPNQCFPGHATVTAIADSPTSQNGSYKLVDFVEYIDLPPELQKLQGYIYTGYKKELTFQKTDDGWRVAP